MLYILANYGILRWWMWKCVENNIVFIILSLLFPGLKPNDCLLKIINDKWNICAKMNISEADKYDNDANKMRWQRI